jgi:hypothetical protein
MDVSQQNSLKCLNPYSDAVDHLFLATVLPGEWLSHLFFGEMSLNEQVHCSHIVRRF